MKPTVAERIKRYSVVTANGCWQWQRSKYSNGYGQIFADGRLTGAHRASYEAFVGPIPTGLGIDHLCRNRACVNPEHLEAVPQRVNTLRSTGPSALNARKTHCRSGHALDGDNVYVGANGHRQCRTCHRLREKARRHRNGPVGVPNNEKTHCRHGHPLSGANLYTDTRGGRQCRTCRTAAVRALRAHRVKKPNKFTRGKR